jgi:hypothetical protein
VITTKSVLYQSARRILDKEREWVTTSVAAIVLGISEHTAVRWARDRPEFGCYRTGNGQWQWPVAELRREIGIEK